MKAVITGAAGFIGSHLVDALLGAGWEVCGIDAFTPYYAAETKRKNLDLAIGNPAFMLFQDSLLDIALEPLCAGADVVFHLAAQPGVRRSRRDFDAYVEANITATQRVVEGARAAAVRRLVYASSSSVYGDPTVFPTPESAPCNPVSPYGVTKLAGELLCRSAGGDMTAVALRFFTAYGPRQRPDMLIDRLIRSVRDRSRPVPMFGDGTQVRDFTFVSDIVRSLVLAATVAVDHGAVFNIAGGSTTSLGELLTLIEDVCGKAPHVEQRPRVEGDVVRTEGSIEQARRVLGWEPETMLRGGIRRQLAFQQGAQILHS